ncbi:MAG TPA: phage tail tape measure protein, partial [Streptosporangiaceae bacterium]|nr:phage tail tape measure protein [Streptosporangiaceae bacterium]
MAISETITIDAGPAIGQLDALAASADKAAAAMERIGKSAAGGGGADKLAASMAAAADRIEAASVRASAAMGRLSTAGRAATGGLDALGASADKAGAGLDRSAAGADASAAAMDRQAAAGDRAAVATERSGKAAAESGGFFSRHKELILGSAIALGYSVDKAMQFNSTMTMLATQANVNTKWIPDMSKGVLQLAGQVGFSPNSLAESLYHVASNMATMKGASPVKMLEATKVAAEGAAVGHSNLVDTTTALTSVLASGIKGPKTYAEAMGVLNATVGSGEMHMQDLAEAMGTGVVPVVKGYGLSLDDVGASLATFGDLNIRGAKAGTDLRMAVQSLSVPAKDGKAQLQAWGQSSNVLAKDMEQGGLIKALDHLNTLFHANGITAKNEGQVITDMFGKKAGVGLAVL